MAYATIDDLDMTFGKTNVDKWADAGNGKSAPEIAARKEWALERATRAIDDRLRGTHYEIPFTTAPASVADMTAALAGVMLYQFPRGMADGEDGFNPMQVVKEEVELKLQQIVAGQIRLDATRISSAIPEVVN